MPSKRSTASRPMPCSSPASPSSLPVSCALTTAPGDSFARGRVARGATRAARRLCVVRAVGGPRPRCTGGPSARLPLRGRGPARAGTLALTRAREELGLTPREFELCLDLGELTVTARDSQGRQRVPAVEVGRLLAAEDHPDGLRARLRLVRASEGAELLKVSRSRFVRLARAGSFAPVRFSVSRYHQLVWHYLALELDQFAERQPDLLRGPLPGGIRAMLREGADWRPRLWRGRRTGQLLRQTSDPWAVAAVHACVLDQTTLEEAVPDPVERRTLARLRPVLAPRPMSVQARGRCGDLFVADAGEETRWHRLGLTLALGTARTAGGPQVAEAGRTTR